MQILHVVPLIDSRASYGGPSRGTLKQAQAQADSGHEVTVVALGDRAPFELELVKIVLFKRHQLPFPREGFAGLLALSPLKWLVENVRQFDVVHFHSGRELWVLLAQMIVRARGVRYCIQTHGMLQPRASVWAKVFDRLLTRSAVCGAHSIMYLTGYERRALEQWSWIPPLRLVLNGVDRIEPRDEGTSRRPGERLQVTTVTRIQERKRVPDLVAAASDLIGAGFPVGLTIYGPDEGDGQAVMDAIEATGLPAGVIEYKGALPYNKVYDVLRDADIFVLPSIAEPFPNSLLEALSIGVPVVCTDQCGLAPYVQEYEAGVVCEPGPSGLRQAMEKLLLEADRARMGRNAITLCNDKFVMSSIVSQIASAYQ